ncbi:Protein DENND6B [Plecturocebus cupreus]
MQRPELRQRLVYPNDFQLTDKEKSSICYLSFPDSHSGCLGDTQFSFRMRQCGGQRSPWHADDRHYHSRAPVALQREPAHYFGYVYFRQVKDSSVKRGYFQKVSCAATLGWCLGEAGAGRQQEGLGGRQGVLSLQQCPLLQHHLGCVQVSCGPPALSLSGGTQGPSVLVQGVPAPPCWLSLVLVSRLPFVRLFQALLSLIAPEYFDKLAPCLEAAVAPGGPGSSLSLGRVLMLATVSTVCSEIDQWPVPVPGQTLNLPVMGVVVQVHIPSRVDKSESSPPKQCDQENLLPAPMVLASVHELDLFRCFRPVLTHVQTLWELMLLGEPLLVLAPSPDVSSEMVLALTSCLQPLRFCCDFRPYFTIHDSEFKEFTTRTQAPPNVVLGVTNPFFIKTLQHWPHILRVGEPKMSGEAPGEVRGVVLRSLTERGTLRACGVARAVDTEPRPPACLVGDLPKQVKLKKPSRLKTLDTKPGLCSPRPGAPPPKRACLVSGRSPGGEARPPDPCSASRTQQRSSGSSVGGALSSSVGLSGVGWVRFPGAAKAMGLQADETPAWLLWGLQECGREPLKGQGASCALPPGLYTAYTAHLHRDKALLKRLLKGMQKKRPSDVQSALLRRHLLELTQSFIIPLEHYMASLMPLQKSITPWKTPPQIRPFSQDDFLRSLEHAGPQLTCILKGDWLGLYRRFFKSPHFDGWYRQRHKEMALKLEALHLEAICEANIETWMKDKSEVEVVDLVLKLREKLVRAQGHQLPVKEATLQQAQLYIETVIGSLPKDLQAVLCPP